MADSDRKISKKRSSSGQDQNTTKKAKKQKVNSGKKDLPETNTSDASMNILVASKAAFDPTLSNLFATSVASTKPDRKVSVEKRRTDRSDRTKALADSVADQLDDAISLSQSGEDGHGINSTGGKEQEESLDATTQSTSARKRKRKDEHDDLEGAYLQRLAKEREKDDQDRKRGESKGVAIEGQDSEDEEEASDQDSDEDEIVPDDDDEDDTDAPPPQHESLNPEGDADVIKAQRTVFLANVSTEVIKSKVAHKTLHAHLSSFFSALSEPKDGEAPHKIESIRFRSTPFAAAIPKKAAFARKEVMDATASSTNAYVVYSSPALAREAAQRLNGTVVLDRHIRVDQVAHPAKVDHTRCVFIGNLGFVDDETNIDKANVEDGYRNNHGNKKPADVEEGLWRTFGNCGTVESVRVVRDSKTRVGKGIAYVQFTDENAVEAALQYNDKRFPPMLPRKLRVSRANRVKRNARPAPDSTRAMPPPRARAGPGKTGGYVPKMTPQQQSQLGRAHKLFGKSAANHMRSQNGPNVSGDGRANTVRAPEDFVFEGHRARSKTGNAGLKLGGKGGNKSKKPTVNSGRRAAAWKAGGGNKKKD